MAHILDTAYELDARIRAAYRAGSAEYYSVKRYLRSDEIRRLVAAINAATVSAIHHELHQSATMRSYYREDRTIHEMDISDPSLDVTRRRFGVVAWTSSDGDHGVRLAGLEGNDWKYLAIEDFILEADRPAIWSAMQTFIS